MDIVVKLFWKQPLSLSEVLPISDIVVNIPFGTMIVDPTLSVPVTSVNSRIGDVVLTATDVGAATEQYVQDQIALLPLSPVTSVNSKVGSVVLTATDVGATTQGYVDTEITTLQTSLQTAINTKADAASVTQSLSTKADLVGGVIPANQLPSFVDDVLEYADLASFPVIGEASKIYVAIDTNKTYRWSSTQYVEIGGGGVALGETSLTAYRGDRGKIAYDHSLSQGNPHNTTTSEIAEGTNKYFTDLRVKNTVLSGLVKTNSSNVTNTDTVEVAVGKLAAKSEAGGSGGTITWIDANTLTGYSKNANLTAATTKVQFAKINGFIWMRGHISTSNSVNAETELFSFTDSRFLLDNTYLGLFNDNQSYDRLIHKNIKIQELAEFRLAAKQIGTGTSGNITHRLKIITDVFLNSVVAALIEPVCIGIAKNP